MYKIYIFVQKKLIRILARTAWICKFVNDPEKRYRSLSEWVPDRCVSTHHSIREWVVKRSAAEECRSRSYSKNWVLWIFMHARILSVAVFLLSYCSLGYQNTSWHTSAFSVQRVFRASAWTVCRRSTSRICLQVADQKTPQLRSFLICYL